MVTRDEEIAAALQLALLLEVSAYPKPGNVHRTSDFEYTKFEHFLASAAALGPHFRYASLRGRAFANQPGRRTELAIGNRIRRAVEDCARMQHGGNTSLGAILLLTPIAYAAGMIPSRSRLNPQEIRKNLRKVVRGTTPFDAADTYSAISSASPGGMGKVPKLDINDESSIPRILSEKLTLLDIFRISANYDMISWEWVNDFSVTFEIGFPYLISELRATGDINTTIVDTYLKILSRQPDTLIARKQGITVAKHISTQAKRVLAAGGMKTARGRERVERMDRALQKSDHGWNPGTTADLTASALSILVLTGYRP